MLGLLALVEDDEPTERVDAGTVVGHVHLHVGGVEDALRLYRDVLGFEVMNRFSNVAFVSAAGYHHHVGLNTWRGEGVPPAPADAVGMRHWTLVVDPPTRRPSPGAPSCRRHRRSGELDGGALLRDPSGNAVLVLAETPVAR